LAQVYLIAAALPAVVDHLAGDWQNFACRGKRNDDPLGAFSIQRSAFSKGMRNADFVCANTSLQNAKKSRLQNLCAIEIVVGMAF
jgi:hypothetical protein